MMNYRIRNDVFSYPHKGWCDASFSRIYCVCEYKIEESYGGENDKCK